MKRLFLAVTGVFVILVLTIVLVIMVVRPTVDLSSYRGIVENLASGALDHRVSLGGDLALSISLKPSIRLTDVSVDYREGDQAGKLLKIEKTELGLALFPLLSREIHITRFIVDGFDLNLRGGDTTAGKPEGAGQKKPKAGADNSARDLPVLVVRIDQFSGQNFDLSYVNPGLKQEFRFGVARFDSKLGHSIANPGNTDFRTYLSGIDFTFEANDGKLSIEEDDTHYEFTIDRSVFLAPEGEAVSFEFSGSYLNESVKSKFTTNSLAEFAEGLKEIDLGLAFKTASTELTVSGTNPIPVSLDDMQFSLSFKGNGVDEFERLTGVDFPPVGSYAISGDFKTRDDVTSISDLNVNLGSSHMAGDFHLDKQADIPKAKVSLTAKRIQLDDFAIESWAGLKSDEAKGQPKPKTEPDPEAELRSVLSPDVLKAFDLEFTLSVDQVASGSNELGHGQLDIHVRDGAIRIDPLQIEIPAGGVEVAAEYKPDANGNSMQLKISSKNFDYGNLAKRLDESSKIGGKINLDLDVTTEWQAGTPILAGGNGYLHFGVWPQELNAGILDFWATNLLIALVPVLDDTNQSKINCLIAKFQMQDGILRADDILLDTDRIQATAIGQVDFTKSTLNFGARPRPKIPQMFSARTPVQVQGKFTDFRYGLKEGALIGTAFRMVTSPIVTPFEWVFRSPPPLDGKAPCQASWEDRKK